MIPKLEEILIPKDKEKAKKIFNSLRVNQKVILIGNEKYCGRFIRYCRAKEFEMFDVRKLGDNLGISLRLEDIESEPGFHGRRVWVCFSKRSPTNIAYLDYDENDVAHVGKAVTMYR